jgi:trehalose 6-phosphate phosphatase
VFVEFKGLTSTVHYRRAIAQDVKVIENIVRAGLAPFESLFEATQGAKALDIVPRTGWHKGCAAVWINERLGLRDALSIYFGDDRSDEDAFDTLSGALTFKVGKDSQSGAKFSVGSHAEVREFLQWLAITK